MFTFNYLTQVNLVSEHIWCNDFLVRSFYLKNVQTQETRTLTQFHFLSWPAKGIPTSTRPLLDFRRYSACLHIICMYSYLYIYCIKVYITIYTWPNNHLVMMVCFNGNYLR